MSSHKSTIKLDAELVSKAVMSCYAQDPERAPTIEREGLIELLTSLQPLTPSEELDHLTDRLKSRYPDQNLTAVDFSQLAFVDDCVTSILERADLDYAIESLIRAMTPAIARLVLEEGVLRITRSHPLLTIIDQLCTHCVGWSHDLGILGERLFEEVEFEIRSLIKQQKDYKHRLRELARILGQDYRRLMLAEKNLVTTGLIQLKKERAKRIAAQAVNREMAEHNFSLFIVLMLQGPWFEFLQEVILSYDETSKRWQRAKKLMEAMAWSLQPKNWQKSNSRVKSLMSSLPEQLSKLFQSCDFDTSRVEQSLGDLESEFECIDQGEPTESCDFDPLTIEATDIKSEATIDASAMEKVYQFKAGQWFIFDDGEERIARIKLILKWDKDEKLVFSNRNRRKLLTMTYHQLGAYLISGTAKPLSPVGAIQSLVKQKFAKVLRDYRKQKKLSEAPARERDGLRIERNQIASRRAARAAAMAQSKKKFDLRRARELRLEERLKRKISAAKRNVESLVVDAWMKLPVIEETMSACRLAAIVEATGKYIFVNRAGVKVGEYTADELMQSLIYDASEIIDTGAEFENVLEGVIQDLRVSKTKSYEELTAR